MKKLMLLICLFLSVSCFGQDTILISGSGAPSPNGIYIPSGTYNGTEYWTLQGGGFYIWWNTGSNDYLMTNILGGVNFGAYYVYIAEGNYGGLDTCSWSDFAWTGTVKASKYGNAVGGYDTCFSEAGTHGAISGAVADSLDNLNHNLKFTATPDAHYRVINFTDKSNKITFLNSSNLLSAVCSLTITGNDTVKDSFLIVPNYTLTMAVSPGGVRHDNAFRWRTCKYR